MTITIIGAGYVGLVTAAIFSELGNKVYCVDVDSKKIENLKNGILPFYEPQLPEFIKRNFKAKRLFFTSKYSESVPKSSIVFICVGTPPKNNGEADLSYLFNAVEETAKNLSGYTLITIKSTIPIGFEDDLEKTVKKYAINNFEFASCPEFLREGSAISDTLNPDRIVIGTLSKKAQKLLLELHAPISGQRIICDIRSAQLIKYASNALLATKISFANAIASLCEKMDADVQKVLEGVGADKRLGRTFLYPGVGYGGSCLPKDISAFISIGNYFDYDFQLLRAVSAVNESQIPKFITKIRTAVSRDEATGKDLSGIHLAILGLSFKPNTDDIRDAPSIKIIQLLDQLGAKITAYDPQSMEKTKNILPKINYANNPYEAILNKDAIVLLTEWPEFNELNFEEIKKIIKKPIIIDGRNFFDKDKVKQLGFKYFGVGR